MDIQRQDRIWDMNKEVLLDLSHTLSKIIEYKSMWIDEAYAAMASQNEKDSDNNSSLDDIDQQIYKKMDRQINNIINVYEPLIGKKLVDNLKQFQKDEKQIDYEVFEEDLDVIEAYNRSLNTSTSLYNDLMSFIRKYSGVEVK